MLMDLENAQGLAKKVLSRISENDQMPIFCIPQDDVDQFSIATPLKALHDAVLSSKKNEEHELVIWLEACLRNPRGLELENEHTAQAFCLIEWVSKSLIPPAYFAAKSPHDIEPPEEASALEEKRYKLKVVTGLRLLKSLLDQLVQLQSEKLPLDLLVCLVSFTDESDPWTLPESKELSDKILDSLFGGEQQPFQKTYEFLPSNVQVELWPNSKISSAVLLLEDCARPAFVQDKNPSITAQARKSINPTLYGALERVDTEPQRKVWKYKVPYVITLYQWALAQLDVSEMPIYRENPLILVYWWDEDDHVANLRLKSSLVRAWRLVVPPILSLLDDDSTPLRIKGCKILQIFLHTTPSEQLSRTGIGGVIELAIFPMLSCLPTLYSEEDTLSLLGVAYPSLVNLAKVQNPLESELDAKRKALEKLLRAGILHGLHHCNDNIGVTRFLIVEMGKLVEELGIYSVKHLKNTIPAITLKLTDPFAMASPGLVEDCLGTLEKICIAGRPRVWVWASKILRGLVACWIRLEDVDASKSEVIGTKLKKVTKTVKEAVSEHDKSEWEKLEAVIQEDSRLEGLL